MAAKPVSSQRKTTAKKSGSKARDPKEKKKRRPKWRKPAHHAFPADAGVELFSAETVRNLCEQNKIKCTVPAAAIADRINSSLTSYLRMSAFINTSGTATLKAWAKRIETKCESLLEEFDITINDTGIIGHHQARMLFGLAPLAFYRAEWQQRGIDDACFWAFGEPLSARFPPLPQATSDEPLVRTGMNVMHALQLLGRTAQLLLHMPIIDTRKPHHGDQAMKLLDRDLAFICAELVGRPKGNWTKATKFDAQEVLREIWRHMGLHIPPLGQRAKSAEAARNVLDRAFRVLGRGKGRPVRHN
jgi:hypothetical protein